VGDPPRRRPGWEERNIYPVWAVLAALTLFLLGGTLGQCYASAAAFFVATLLMPLLPGAPLLHGLTWTAVMVTAGCQMLRRAGRRPPTQTTAGPQQPS
jgi:uncharacterized MAPEG superfamily protein